MVHVASPEELRIRNRVRSSECAIVADENAHSVSDEDIAHRMIPMDGLPDGYFEMDSKGRFTSVNSTLCRLVERDLDALMGQEWRHIVLLSDHPVMAHALDRVLGSDPSARDVTAGWMVSDGSERRGQWSLGPILGENSLIVGIRGILRDITEREHLETDLRLHCHRLEAMTARQHEQLAILNRQFLAAQKMEAIGTLSSSIAHNFNNILMGVQGSIDLMRCHHGLEGHLIKHLDRIGRLIDNGSRLTGNLLGYVATNRPKLEQVSIRSAIQNAAELILATRNDIRFVFDLPTDPLWCGMDSGHLEQVFMNLYVNAMDAMPEGGGITITAEHKPRRDMDTPGFIPVEEAYAVVQVQDTGPGMPAKVRDHVFDPLFTTKPAGKGTGLGLSSVRMTLETHGGHISVASTPGAGTVFTLWIPIADQQTRPSGIIQEKPLSGRETILLFDADPVIRETFSGMLDALGYRIRMTEDWAGVTAAAHPDHGMLDLAILDSSVFQEAPGERIACLEQLRPGLKIIFTSGRPGDRSWGNRPEHHFLQKPFSLGTLSTTIRNLLVKEWIP